jgi:hypothetical protein
MGQRDGLAGALPIKRTDRGKDATQLLLNRVLR